MAKTIAFINQKGGVGKSTSAASVGIGLARAGKKVLLVDADPQANLSDSLGYKNPDELDTTLCTLMEKTMDDAPLLPGEGILHQSEGVDLIPGNIELSGLEVALVNAMSRETVLRATLAELKGRYDYILIDCPPSLNMLTINAMTAADSLIIPCQADYLPAKGLALLLKSANRVRKQLNPGLQIDGIRRKLASELGESQDWYASYGRDQTCSRDYRAGVREVYETAGFASFLKDWTEKHGLERCVRVLSYTVSRNEHDLRYYSDVKARAARYEFPDGDRIADLTPKNVNPEIINASMRELMWLEKERTRALKPKRRDSQER